jgi:hypothetical protein
MGWAVAHTCNPTYLEGGSQEDQGLRLAPDQKEQTLRTGGPGLK